MNTGQMMLTIGALMLLSTIILRMNTSFTDTSIGIKRNSFDVMAVSLATSYLEEVKRQAYDEKTVTAAISNVNNFSTSLGRDAGESRSTSSDLVNANTFDDVDDFNGDSFYTELPSGSDLPPAVYKVDCTVAYFNPATLNTTTSTQWSKKITVTVTGTAMSGPVKLTTIYSYWKFR